MAISQRQTTKTKRVFPRISEDWYRRLSAIARERELNLSQLTRQLYEELLEKESSKSKASQ